MSGVQSRPDSGVRRPGLLPHPAVALLSLLRPGATQGGRTRTRPWLPSAGLRKPASRDPRRKGVNSERLPAVREARHRPPPRRPSRQASGRPREQRRT